MLFSKKKESPEKKPNFALTKQYNQTLVKKKKKKNIQPDYH